MPRIGFFNVEGHLCTATVWTDGIPVVLPETDVVLVYRDEHAPRGWLRRKPGIATAKLADVRNKLGNVRSESSPLAHYFTTYDSPPADLVEWIKSLPPAKEVESVSMDQVLDEE